MQRGDATIIRKSESHLPGHVHVEFELPASTWADRIFLAGDFNDWDQTATPMHQTRSGSWRAALDLPAGGRYEFLYLIDGQWNTDFHADGSTPNIHGSENSVIITELDDRLRFES